MPAAQVCDSVRRDGRLGAQQASDNQGGGVPDEDAQQGAADDRHPQALRRCLRCLRGAFQSLNQGPVGPTAQNFQGPVSLFKHHIPYMLQTGFVLIKLS